MPPTLGRSPLTVIVYCICGASLWLLPGAQPPPPPAMRGAEPPLPAPLLRALRNAGGLSPPLPRAPCLGLSPPRSPALPVLFLGTSSHSRLIYSLETPLLKWGLSGGGLRPAVRGCQPLLVSASAVAPLPPPPWAQLIGIGGTCPPWLIPSPLPHNGSLASHWGPRPRYDARQRTDSQLGSVPSVHSPHGSPVTGSGSRGWGGARWPGTAPATCCSIDDV